MARHEGLLTNAFDLGYVSQALWYDAHGEPFRFTTVQGADTVVEGVDLSKIKHPHWLLAFHVEPALLLLAPLYRWRPDPTVLLWLQAAAIALGALPAAALARRLIGGPIPALVFGLAWLLTPGLEGAALSDFHMVAIGATLLMAGLWLLETGHRRWAVACLALTALTREDAAAAVAWLGIVLVEAFLLSERRGSWLPTVALSFMENLRQYRPLALVAAASGLWALACFGLILPLFSGGGSAFAQRYAWLAHIGRPGVLAGWLPEATKYAGLQVLTGGTVALLAPLQLLVATPLLALNTLSSFDWMRSGGGHYSALLAPLLLWAGMHGVRALKGRWGTTGALAGLAIALVSAITAQVWAGVWPVKASAGGDPRAPGLLAALSAVPPDAPVSATSALYPHLSARHEAYWFPALLDADWVAIDAVADAHPLSPADVHERTIRLLERPGMEIVTAENGLLIAHQSTNRQRDGLLAADASQRSLGAVLRRDPSALPASFYDFARSGADLPTAATPLRARFGDSVELAGYELRRQPQVGLLGGSATLVTYWRTLHPVTADLRFGLASTRSPDGALAGIRMDPAAAPLWLPTSRWQPGELMRLEMQIDQLGGLQALGVLAVDQAGQRLPIAAPISMTLWDGDTIAEVARVS